MGCFNILFKISNLIKTFFNNLALNLRIFLIGDPIKEESLNLTDKLNTNISISNFNASLAINGLNSPKFANIYTKLWTKFLIIVCLIGFIKTLILFNVDPVKDYKLCFLLGDITLVFKSLRKYFMIIILSLLSLEIFLIKLFNHNPHFEWYELFTCLDGTLTPKSIGIRDKRILKKMLILTKFSQKFVKIFLNSTTSLMFPFSMHLVFENIKINNLFDLFISLSWFPFSFIMGHIVAGTIITATFTFEIICFYCLIQIKYYNKLIDNIKNETSFGCKRFIINLKIRNIIKNQIKFSVRILKYNKFWKRFYFMFLLHILPANIIAVQQILFGHSMSYQSRILFILGAVIGIVNIISSSFIASLLTREMKIHTKKLIHLQFHPYLNLNINTKIKVYHRLIIKLIYKLIKLYFRS